MVATRWGILSTGLISQDFTTALKHLPQDEHQVGAVAARSLDSAKKFAERFSVQRAYGTYKELVEDPDLDIIYIGTIHPTHYDACLMSLNAGKHVLCEKPMCMNTKEAQAVLDLAKEKGLFFLEGFWSRFFPVYHRLREVIADGTIGEPRVVRANFGVDIVHTKRITEKELGGGALLDLGCYAVQMTDLMFGKPDHISAVSTKLQTDVDESTVITMIYPGNKMAIAMCSVSCLLSNHAIIHGTKGTIEVPHMGCPVDIIINDKKERYPLPEFLEFTTPLNFYNSQGFTYEAKHVREMLLKGALQSPLMPHSSSLNVAQVMTEARGQTGIEYDADK